MDCVLTYHQNPLTCGVARFNVILSRRFGVPMLGVLDSRAMQFRTPLVSVRFDELTPADAARIEGVVDQLLRGRDVGVFLHTYMNTAPERALVDAAAVVYCGNAEIAARLARVRPDVVEVWCPSMLLDVHPFLPTDLSVFSFGMAHKVRAEHYQTLQGLLAATGRSYSLYLSTALHENTALDGSFTQAYEELRLIFGPSIYFLGYLSDAAVHHYLGQCTFFAAFFDRGARANNTTVTAAMQAGRVAITNLDAYSPPAFVHMQTVIDIARCESLPTDPARLQAIGARAAEVAQRELGWEGLVARVAAHEVQQARRGSLYVSKPHDRR